MACVDETPVIPEYKLLQLRQYLSSEALEAIQSLSHSPTAYKAAKERLDWKYGGQRVQDALYLEELDSFKPVRDAISKDVERFSDLLDAAIVNFQEAGRVGELGNGVFYISLQKKLTEPMLVRHHRWIIENVKTESVLTLREWIIQEAEFQTIRIRISNRFKG